MEALAMLLVLISVVGSIVKKAKDYTRQKEADAPGPPRAAKQAPAAKMPVKPQPFDTFPTHPYQERQTKMETSASSLESLSGSPGTPYLGSLGGTSLEGVDICDDSLGHRDRSSPIYEEEIGGAARTLPLDGESIIQGMIMSEVLTRPTARKWGKYRWNR